MVAAAVMAARRPRTSQLGLETPLGGRFAAGCEAGPGNGGQAGKGGTAGQGETAALVDMEGQSRFLCSEVSRTSTSPWVLLVVEVAKQDNQASQDHLVSQALAGEEQLAVKAARQSEWVLQIRREIRCRGPRSPDGNAGSISSNIPFEVNENGR